MKPCDLFLGRLQPLHRGHVQVIQGMENPVVAIVRGEKSSKNLRKNPLGFSYQVELLRYVFPGIEVIEVPTGYIPDIILAVQDKLGYRVTTVHAGSDRLPGYRKQVMESKELDESQKAAITFKETPRPEGATSATLVRQALREGDRATFQNHTPPEIWGEYETLYKLTEEKKYAHEIQRMARRTRRSKEG